ncbi:MAG: sulfurtransferase TusA family protein [Alphaproteobacteria bacterium]|nr:sulfurtransferase TusA family protein [Alphaproteobacteria bacterium]
MNDTSNAAPVAPDKVLDTKGLTCPLPVLRAKKAIKELAPGQVMKVLATDPGSVADFANFCKATGSELLASTTEDNVFVYLIRKGA